MSRVSLSLALIICGAASWTAPAHASCTVSVAGVAFGAYDTLSATPDDSTGTVSATCLLNDAVPDVDISAGASASFASRRMSNGGATLGYNLYSNAARSIVWGDGTGGTAGAPLTLQRTFLIWRVYSRTIYGRIPARQNVSAGPYVDALVVTVNF